MPDTRNLTLALQDGFKDDEVVISSGETALQRLDKVSTRTQIGLAREVPLAVPAGTGSLTIAVPSRGIRETVVLPASAAHLGISLDPDGRSLTIRRSAEPFGYV